MSVEIATILPLSCIHKTINERYHLSLAHLLHHPVYFKFFRNQVLAGKFVIMDNGAAEKGGAITLDTLLERTAQLQPSEIVLPDILYDCNQTLARSRAAIPEFLALRKPPQLMAVPQGRTWREWKACALEMLSWPEISTLGISKFITPELGAHARLEAVEWLYNVAQIDNSEHPTREAPIDIHLLGCWSFPTEVEEITSKYRIRGTDSAIAYVYTANNLVLTPSVPRPQMEIDFLSTQLVDEDLLIFNLRRWRRYVYLGYV